MLKAIITMEKNDEIIELELFEKEAPGTVANFVKLIEDGYYDGLKFHRVIPGFVSQGGCPNGSGSGGPGYTIKCETANNPHKHLAGTLSMAHAGKDTGGSQFFIVHEPQSHLDGLHTVFGQTLSGLDTVLKMKNGDVIKKIVIERG